MKARFINGTTINGKAVNGGDIVDLDEQHYRLFVHRFKDAVPYDEPAKAPEAPAVVAPEVESKPKGKK